MNPESNRFQPQATTLIGQHVELVPLNLTHAAHLAKACSDQETWRYMPTTQPIGEPGFAAWIESALESARDASQVPLAIVLTEGRLAIGSTRYLNIRPQHRSLEIGYTWIGPQYRRTAVNTECKLLLTSHAFEDLGAVRVEFKTDARNERSQAALSRIGAQREGVLRKHMILWDGHCRDSVYYSITDTDWPAVKHRLQSMLA